MRKIWKKSLKNKEKRSQSAKSVFAKNELKGQLLAKMSENATYPPFFCKKPHFALQKNM